MMAAGLMRVLFLLPCVIIVLGQCPVNEFYCPVGYCIPQNDTCNGVVQCQSGADELIPCNPVPDCPIEFERCPTTGHSGCLYPPWRCDGFNDCGDYSDEDPAFCSNTPCPADMVKCTVSNRCIQGRFFCNGIDDCGDGSGADEPTAYCNSASFTCPADHFMCNNGNCVPEHWICDTDNDCGDGSDEAPTHDCSTITCRSGYFRCKQNKPGLSPCIPMSYTCDGLAHCEEADDELLPSCPVPAACDAGFFQCNNLLCIHSTWECDRDNDCGDGSDEGSQCEYPTCAPATEITCGNGRCVRREYLCDGTDDCRDMSDESPTVCGTVPPDCSGETVLCRGECVMPEDCDIDQCTLFPLVCSQICENLGRSRYRCSCRPGYDIQPDGISCLAKSTETPYLLFCNKFYLRRSNTFPSNNAENGVALARDFSFLVAFDFDYIAERLYLTDVTAHTIISMKIDGSDRKVIVNQYTYDVEGIAVDWVSRKLFWTDRYLDVLEVAELNGTSRKTLVRENMFEPRAVAVDPRHGYVYWTDWGLNAYIGRVGMDGSNETELHNRDIVWPNGITIDYTSNKVYWTDAHLDYIAYADLDFSNVHHVISDDTGNFIAHPFSVTVFEDTMYWTDWNLFKVYSANKRDASNVKEVLIDLVHRPMDIHIMHPLRQDSSITNPCGANNGGCSHLCLIKPGGNSEFQCACPDNFRLLDDGKSCESDCINTQYLCESNSRCIHFYWQCDGEDDCTDGADEIGCPHRVCDPGYFQCEKTYSCVHPNLLCNGEDDCNDNSDEAHCAEAECQNFEFRCNNGRCIQHVAVCDQTDDCGDNSDEMSTICAEHQCYDGYFKCDNGFCIPQSWFCDLDNDCGDHSDEPLRECQRRSCETGWFSCATNYRCVPGWAVCYGGDHCRDNSDESNCAALTCDPLGEFRCNSHQCIPTRWFCDRESDCPDSSDEPAGCIPRVCSESEYKCLDDRCIPGAWVCDGDFDCGGADTSDEVNCQSRTCPDDQFQCVTTGYCIDNLLVCDGRAACEDASDEANCPTRFPGGLWCPTDELFTCDNTVCIPKFWVCDGENDCIDNSDESIDNCEVVNVQCDSEHSRWRCADGVTCILEFEVCDNRQHCPDGSDETNCDTNRPCDPNTEFSCGNGLCIPLEAVCNSQNDCDNELDEKECGSGDCNTDNGGCQQVCQETTTGSHYCRCWEGYIADPNAPKQCIDIDECIDQPCPQICYNLQPRPGRQGYTCQCATGFRDYSSAQDGTLCETDGTQFILIASGSEIVKYYPKEERFADFVNKESQVEGIDYHIGTERVYFIDKIQRAMKEVHKDATSLDAPNNLGIDELYSPVGLAIDWVANNIYFTDYGEEGRETGRSRRAAADIRPKVGVLSPTGNIHHWREAVIIDKVERPTGLAVNPAKGLLYWTDLGSTATSTPMIEMSWMNGRNRQEITSDYFVQPSGLSIDFNSNQTVYFCDQKADIIGYFGWDGWNVRILARSDVLAAPLQGIANANPYQLDVFESYIYWTTGRPGTTNYVMKVGKNTTQFPSEVLFSTPVNTLGSIKVYHERRYMSDIPNPCARAQCTDMCVLTPPNAENEVYQGFDCICGTSASDDEQIHDCENDNPIILTTKPETPVKTTELSTEMPVKPSTEQPTETPVKPSTEQLTETTVKPSTEQPTETPVKPSTGQSTEPPKMKTTQKPVATKPPCGCINGGTCKSDGSCVCFKEYSGDYCEIGSPNGPGKNTGSASGLAIGAAVGVATLIILLLILVVIVLLCYVKKKKGASNTPVAYRTGDNVVLGDGVVAPPVNGEPIYESGLPRTPVTFENPGFGGGAAGGGDPEKTGLPPEFGGVLPEKVDLSAPGGRPNAPENPYTNMPIGIDPYNQMVNPPEPPPAYSPADFEDDLKK